MQYSVMCYGSENAGHALSQAEDDKMMAELAVIEANFPRKIKLRAGVRLMPTTAATTLHYGRSTMVIDGPFAETKEQLLGFYLIDCDTLEDAIEATHMLIGPRVAAGLIGSLEIRPVAMANLG